MSSMNIARLLSRFGVGLALVLGMMSITPAAHAEPTLITKSIAHDCKTGQTVTLYLGPLTATTTPSGAPASIEWAGAAVTSPGNKFADGVVSGNTATFPAISGIAVTGGVISYYYNLVTSGDTVVPDESTAVCIGLAADDDGDGVPNDDDVCTTQPGSQLNGCPFAPALSVLSTTPAHDGQSDGSVTFLLGTASDPKNGDSETFAVRRSGNQIDEVGPVADGSWAQFTTATRSGDELWCVSGSGGSSACLQVVVDAIVAQPPYAGQVDFNQTDGGLVTHVTNTGTEGTQFVVTETTWFGFFMFTESAFLAPGESMTVNSGRTIGAFSTVRMEKGSYGDVQIDRGQWNSRSMLLPAKKLNWGKKLTKHRARPSVLVSTKAYRTRVGVQVKGQGAGVIWLRTYGPGKHRVRLDPVRPHRSQRVRVWVSFYDPGTGAYFKSVAAGPGQIRLTGWHTYRRP